MTRLVRGHHPEPQVIVRSLKNGTPIVVTVSAAAAFIVQGDAELIGEPTPELSEAIDTYLAIHAVQRFRS